MAIKISEVQEKVRANIGNIEGLKNAVAERSKICIDRFIRDSTKRLWDSLVSRSGALMIQNAVERLEFHIDGYIARYAPTSKSLVFSFSSLSMISKTNLLEIGQRLLEVYTAFGVDWNVEPVIINDELCLVFSGHFEGNNMPAEVLGSDALAPIDVAVPPPMLDSDFRY